MKKISLNSTANNDPATNSKPVQPAQTKPQVVKAEQTNLDETKKIGQNLDSPNNQTLKQLNLNQKKTDMTKRSKQILIIISLVALIAGTGTGFGAYKLKAKNQSSTSGPESPIQTVAGEVIEKGDIFGVQDQSTFKDNAQGYLALGGIDGEGSHRLLRAGGVSQTVYLTSTVTDLDKLIGMEVKVWGETYKGQEAGWLMDVGKIEVIEPEAEAPIEANF